jgi:GntR family transcriptional regulator, arabinose operon transcriptional repressor
MNKATAPLTTSIPSVSVPRYRQIYDDLHDAIQSGTLQPGDRLPSEAQLGKQYKTSRITVAKAVNELYAQGFVTRRAGSGTRVLAPSATHGHLFGALIPDFGHTEIFEPICRGMMQHPASKTHSLLWGHFIGGPTQQEKEAESLCHRYIAQKVSGVFFAPLEFTPHKDAVNRRIVAALDRAGIKVVLLDRCFAPYPARSHHDLVGIDNRQAGYLITQHLLRLGVSRIVFTAKPGSANTVLARIAGFHEALLAHGQRISQSLVYYGDPEEPGFVRKLLKNYKPEALVCANDITAARVMVALADYGVRVPEEMRIVGIDDVKYASLLPVPLTTQHQNCNDIGAMAMITMLQRVENPSLPTIDVLLQTRTVVRSSCGAHLHASRRQGAPRHKPRT